jgi:hypothetical protein
VHSAPKYILGLKSKSAIKKSRLEVEIFYSKPAFLYNAAEISKNYVL